MTDARTGISVVVNTLEAERHLPYALRSVASWVDEMVVVDMESTDRTVSESAAAGNALAIACTAPGSLASGYAMPPRNSNTRNNAFAAARFASARSVPAISSPMPENAIVPIRRRPSAGTRPAGTCQPKATPVAPTSNAEMSSKRTTTAVLAASRPPRDSGVDPSRFSTP